MFPREGNGVRPYQQDSFESWHQVLPQPPRPTQNPDTYKWNNINALFEDHVQVVSVSHLKHTADSKRGTSKPKKKIHLPRRFKVKRVGKNKIGGKLFYRSVGGLNISSKDRKWRLKLLKLLRGTPATSRLQNTK